MNKNNKKKKSKKNKSKLDSHSIVRFNPDPKVGLTANEVNKRNEENLLNISKLKTSKSLASIFIKNVFNIS